ncbi:hypothetical protein PaeCFBP13512_06265 [Paenibacillus sp. CFBP13512]|uniref:hypothetical protein n=1 Tax=Paenibacillus sp. CFBP13512 TaxID=2184007 RepID=UPI0010C09663|nr:hypothetical protein [Paenibacillus sp. CFBP13512]TKJ92948.1 hypothetical protein PaeCFBP13512_06265 [Paenibacillus sp. CFBP13512]
MKHLQKTLEFQLQENDRYAIKNQGILSKELFGKRNKNSWVQGEGVVYVLLDSDTKEYIYVGECSSNRSPLATINSGLNRLYSYGFKGKTHSVDAHFFTFGPMTNYKILEDQPKDKQIKYLTETIEAEIVYHIREKTGNWPKFQNEIHFRNDLKNDMKIQQQIGDVIKELDLN